MIIARKLRIGISGSYGGINMGDEAILQSMLAQIKKSFNAHITIFSKNPEDTIKRHGVDHSIDIRKRSKNDIKHEIESLDVFILGGGGILYDNAANFFLREVEMANEAGVPVFVYAISAGPLNKHFNRKLVASILNEVEVITVRDNKGKILLEDLGVEKEIVVTADPAVLLSPEKLPEDALLKEGLSSKKHLIGLSVREPGPAAPHIDINHYHSLLADVADFLIERIGAHIVFVPMERNYKDLQHGHAVISKMINAQHASILQQEYTSGELLAWMGHFDFVVGMRLHFLIFSAIMGVPFIPLPYASKVEGFIEELDLDMPPLSEVTSGRLLAHVDHSWDTRNELKALINKNFPIMQKRALVTNQLLIEMIKNHLSETDYAGLRAT